MTSQIQPRFIFQQLAVWTPNQFTPCQAVDPESFFAEEPEMIEAAKLICAPCQVKEQCLQAALIRSEPHGVWGGELLVDGMIVEKKRPRGRPRTRFPDPEPIVAIPFEEYQAAA